MKSINNPWPVHFQPHLLVRSKQSTVWLVGFSMATIVNASGGHRALSRSCRLCGTFPRFGIQPPFCAATLTGLILVPGPGAFLGSCPLLTVSGQPVSHEMYPASVRCNCLEVGWWQAEQRASGLRTCASRASSASIFPAAANTNNQDAILTGR